MSEPEHLVIIGADAAGMSAASEARRQDPNLRNTAFDRGGYASYSQCGMPYWLGGVVPSREHLTARTLQEFMRRGIQVFLHHDVTSIHPDRGVIEVIDLQAGGTVEHPFDHLLIATGADARRPDLPGADLDGVFQLDVMEDAIAIQAFLERHAPKRAVVVGGGYIGLEMAENLARRGLHVHLIELGRQVFPSVDLDIAAPIRDELERHGVDASLCESVAQACKGENGRVRQIQTSRGAIPADMVLLAIGARPNTSLARLAGIRLGATGAIAVDKHLRTSHPSIYAAGDCAEHWHRVLAKPTWVPLGTTANKQGRLVGRNITGGDDAFAGIVGTAVTRVFDLEIARTGLSEREARDAGLEVASATLASTDRAGYMPDAQPLTIKLIAEEGSGKLLGGQAVGKAGAAKRIDVLATALYSGLDLTQLTQLDLAYAPPFNSVWDPVQVAATKLLRREAGQKRAQKE